MMKKVSVFLLGGAAVILSTNQVVADTITKPYTFTEGTPASATEVNADFDTVYNQVNKMGNLITADDINGILNVYGSLAVESETSKGSISTTRYSESASSLFIGKRARGTIGSPSPVLNGDNLATFGGYGYAANGWPVPSPIKAMMRIIAAEDWTGTSYGADISFETTAIGTSLNTEKMRITGAGYVGIGTTSPESNLEVASDYAVSGSPSRMYLTTYRDDSAGSPAVLRGRRARGSMASPAPVLNGDYILSIGSVGYRTTGWGNEFYNAAIRFVSTEDFTDTATGTAIDFRTTPNGSTTAVDRMTIDQNGFVGIGTTTPERDLDIVADHAVTGSDAGMSITTYYDGPGHPSIVSGKRARGTIDAPLPLQSGDKILTVSGQGYDGVSFGSGGPGGGGTSATMQFIATESFTETAKGTNIIFQNTPNGSASRVERMRIDQNGNVGIGTITPQATLDVNGYMKLAKNAIEPATCDAEHDGALALTSGNRMCVCDGSTLTWVFTSDGTTNCSWE